MKIPAITLTSLVVAAPLFGQQRSFDVEASLDCFEARALATIRTCPSGVLGVTTLLDKARAYSTEDVKAFFEGLMELAVHHDSSIVRTSAATYLMAAGEHGRDVNLPSTQLMVRRVLEAAEDDGATMAIVRRAPLQRDRTFALDLLSEVAVRDDGHLMDPPMSATAVLALRSMGPLGRNRLEGLVASGAIRNARAREAAIK